MAPPRQHDGYDPVGRRAEARARCAPEIQRMMLSPESVVPQGELVLQLNQVVLPFGSRTPINLSLTGAMRMAILGANGSGKSTLLRVIAGQLPVAAGEWVRSCHIGWLDQDAGLEHPERTAVQWLYESNPLLPQSEARTRLAQMGIDADRAMLDTYQLSGGERLKIALAAQLYAQRPPQLLLWTSPITIWTCPFGLPWSKCSINTRAHWSWCHTTRRFYSPLTWTANYASEAA